MEDIITRKDLVKVLDDEMYFLEKFLMNTGKKAKRQLLKYEKGREIVAFANVDDEMDRINSAEELTTRLNNIRELLLFRETTS